MFEDYFDLFYNSHSNRYSRTDTEDGYQYVLCTPGINKVSIDFIREKNSLVITGDNVINGQEYEYEQTLTFTQKELAEVKEIKARTECGITVIDFILYKLHKKDIKITIN